MKRKEERERRDASRVGSSFCVQSTVQQSCSFDCLRLLKLVAESVIYLKAFSGWALGQILYHRVLPISSCFALPPAYGSDGSNLAEDYLKNSQ